MFVRIAVFVGVPFTFFACMNVLGMSLQIFVHGNILITVDTLYGCTN